jgi:hypothetical protein
MISNRTAYALAAATVVLACAGQPPAQGTPDTQTAPVAQGAPPAEGTPAAAPPAGSAAQPPAGSPRDSAVATLGGARVAVDYGRPYKRGRQIFGGLVPYNAVWRTGANAATTLVTSQALRMGSTTVPAGTYTLYTLPTESAWTLIINRQTGQWGTEYNQGQDLARVPMRVTTVPTPVEQFTIAVEPNGQNAGVLAITWDTTRAELPFTVVR